MRQFFKYVLMVALTLAPVLLVQAQIADPDGIFDIATTDNSVLFLGQLFGNVGTVLYGSGQILSILFRYFNLGVLVVAGIFLIWTTVKVVVHSSHEGSFMGKNVDTGFHVIRTVLGIGLLTPTAGGYSIIQIIVMWAVLQGAGFANTVWTKALDYFEEGGQIFVPPSTNLQPLIQLTGTILESQICMYYHEHLEKALQTEARKKIIAGDTSPLYAQRVLNFPSYQPRFVLTNPNNPRIFFPASRGNDPSDNGCGEITYGQSNPAQNSTVESALRAVIRDTAGVARRNANPYAADLIVDQSNGTTPLQQMTGTALVNAAINWLNYLLPIRTEATNTAKQQAFFASARKEGWIYAGSYYYQLSSIQRAISDSSNVGFQLVSTDAYCISPLGPYIAFPNPGDIMLKNDCIKSSNEAYANSEEMPDFATVYRRAGSYAAYASQLALQQQTAAANLNVPTITAGDAGQLNGMMGTLLGLASSSVQTIANPVGDPIMKLQKLGKEWIDTAIATWIGLAMLMFFVSLVASLLSSISSIGYAFQGMMIVFITMYMALLGILMAQGVVISIYVPLIPFVTFTFAVVGWLIAVIEAMVAAPLVALGVTHPEGQGMMGKGEQAIMLLLGVFLRPALMVMGLLAGMLLSYIALTLFNKPLGAVLFSSVGIGLTGFGAFYGLMSIYTVLVTQIVTQSYSLIYHIPDRVLRWLGQQVEASSVAQAVQAGEGQAKTSGEGMSRGMTMPSGGGGEGGGGGKEGGGSAGGKGGGAGG